VRERTKWFFSAWIWEFNWTLCSQLGGAGAAADAQSFGKIGFETRGKCPRWNERWSDMAELTQDKETGQALHLSITSSPLPNPIPNEICHRVGKRNSSQHCMRASDLSSTGIIIGTSGKCSEDARGYGECISLLVCHSVSPSCPAPSEPNTSQWGLVKVRGGDSAGEAVQSRKDGESGTGIYTEGNSYTSYREDSNSNTEEVTHRRGYL